MSKVVATLLIALAALLSSATMAQVRLVAGEVVPFAYIENGVEKGVAYDMLKEMARRVGHSGAIEIQPFSRALRTAKEGDVLAIPFGRNAEREPNYKWIAELMVEDFVLVSNVKSNVDISTLTAGKVLKVGVMRGSVGERLARDQNFANIEVTTREDSNAKMLDAGRIDVWFGAWNTIAAAQRLAGLDVKNLRRGAVAHKVHIYLVAGPSMDERETARWVGVLAAMRKDGTYAQILKQYNYELPG